MAGRAAGRGGRPLLGGGGGGKRGGRPSTAIVAALLLACAALLLLLALGALSLPGASDGVGRGAGLARPRFRRSAFESYVFFSFSLFLAPNLFFRAFAGVC
jgi:prolyl 4-hydroxylase